MLRRIVGLLTLTALTLPGCSRPEAPPEPPEPPSAPPGAVSTASEVGEPTIRGRVESTSTVDLGARTSRLPEAAPWFNLSGVPAYAATNFQAVGGVPVRLYSLGDAGAITGPPLDEATADQTGYYTVRARADDLGAAALRYAVVAGDPAVDGSVANEDWNSPGLRRFVTGSTNQDITPVTDVVFDDLVTEANAQSIDVTTIPPAQVEAYHTSVFNDAQGLDLNPTYDTASTLNQVRNRIRTSTALIEQRTVALQSASPRLDADHETGQSSNR